MEGTLWKWTNYFNGWQQRWFILHNGILSYYLSSNDVNESCKGSLNIPACDILTYNSDPTRMDLVIPREAYFYLKAENHSEKQKWLKCFGSAKACYSISDSINKTHEMDKIDANEILLVKKSELRVYCDLLMQQVNEIKLSMSDNQKNVDSDSPLNASSNVLGATCDAFVRILDDCMQLSGATVRRHLSRLEEESPDSSKINSPTTGPHKSGTKPSSLNGKNITEADVESNPLNGLYNHKYPENHFQKELLNNHQCVPTFFSLLQYSFVDIRLTTNFQIPTVSFLNACRSFITIFDRLNHTAFVPAKLDMACNIKKIYQKHLCDAQKFSTLESIMINDVDSDIAQDLNSATLAILWLSRSLNFAEILLRKLAASNADVEFRLIVTEVYESTLASHHGPVLRNAFFIAISSTTTVQDMINRLLQMPQDSNHMDQIINSKGPIYHESSSIPPTGLNSDQLHETTYLNGPIVIENSSSSKYDWSLKQLRSDIIDYLEGMRSILQILFQFIVDNNLDLNDRI